MIIPSVILLIISSAESYRILGVFPMAMHSHYKLASTLLIELANRGHDVTVINPYPQKTPLKNFRDIPVDSIIGPINEHKKQLFSLENANEFDCARFLTSMGMTMTEKSLQHSNVQKLLNSNEQFDVVIIAQFMNEAHMAIAQHFGAPLVLMASMPVFSWTNFMLANPAAPSYVPNLLGKFSGDMTFFQRLQNTFYDLATIMYHQLILLPKHKKLARTLIPSHPNLEDSLNNVSLVLINSHESIYDAVPHNPNIIQIGGLHVHPPPKPENLPLNLRQFLDEATNGVIVFSMGSNLKSSDLPPVKRDAILKSFAKLRQKVIWKWEANQLPNQPRNVKIMEWLPQQDILAHPNVQAFISHGGLLSTIESIYHGIPIVGIPVFTDQKMNVATAVSKGYALAVPLRELTEDKFSYALQQILNNPKYRENAKMRSKIMHDQPIKPIDSAIYWIEYVIRHKGAVHLRHGGIKLTWYQRHLLDIFTFVIASIALIFTLIYVAYKRIFKDLSTNKTKKNL